MNYLKSLGKIFAVIIVGLIILTIFHYFDIFGTKIVNTIKTIIILIAMFIGGFSLAKNSLNKGWLAGIKIAAIYIALTFILQLIFWKSSFSIDILLYYLILLITSIFGGIIGINFNTKKDAN